MCDFALLLTGLGLGCGCSVSDFADFRFQIQDPCPPQAFQLMRPTRLGAPSWCAFMAQEFADVRRCWECLVMFNWLQPPSISFAIFWIPNDCICDGLKPPISQELPLHVLQRVSGWNEEMGTRTAQKEIWQRQHPLGPFSSNQFHQSFSLGSCVSLKLPPPPCAVLLVFIPPFWSRFWVGCRSRQGVAWMFRWKVLAAWLFWGVSIFSDVFRPDVDDGRKTIQKFWVICFSFCPGIGYSYGALPTVEFFWMTKKIENLPIFWTCSTRRMGEFLGLGLDSPESTGKYQKSFKHVGSTKSNQKFYRFLKVPSEVEKNGEKSHGQVWPDLRRQGQRSGWDDSHASTPSSRQKVMNQEIKIFPSFHVQ